MAWVSGGLGATNACTGMYRLAFIAEHGMRSYKGISGPPVRERVWTSPDMGAILTIKGLVRGGISW